MAVFNKLYLQKQAGGHSFADPCSVESCSFLLTAPFFIPSFDCLSFINRFKLYEYKLVFYFFYTTMIAHLINACEMWH